MKKILIVNDNLRTGGIQKSLVNLLNEVAGQYDITLYLFNFTGEYIASLPPSIKTMKAPIPFQLLTLSQQASRKMGVFYYLLRAVLAAYTKCINNHLPLRLLFKYQKKIKSYDIAISFMQSFSDKVFAGGCNEFVLQRVDCQTKISFLHCDYLEYGGRNTYNQNIYRKFDYVAAVSEGCRERFSVALPDMKDRTVVVKNCHPYSTIKELSALDPVNYSQEFFHIVTVARLSEEKGLLRVVPIIEKLINEHCKVIWHIIGNGSQYRELETEINACGLGQIIRLLGHQDNPYRYLKNADLFLLPSFHEAAPMVIDEAKCIGLPILTTDTISAKEMVENCQAGWVCGNNTESIYQTLKYLIRNRQIVNQKKTYLSGILTDNREAVGQFRKLTE